MDMAMSDRSLQRASVSRGRCPGLKVSGLRALLAVLLVFLPVQAVWARPSAAEAEEIEHLIGYLTSSDCTFNRNGTWYAAQHAAQHLRDKYDYLLKRDLVTTAESFIERAASRSSLSGKPYLVRCGSAAPLQSETWFRTELKRFRELKRVAANASFQPGAPVATRLPHRAPTFTLALRRNPQ